MRKTEKERNKQTTKNVERKNTTNAMNFITRKK